LAEHSFYICPPDYKLKGIEKYLLSPNQQTLEILSQIADFTLQVRYFHELDEDGCFEEETKGPWCVEATEFCLTTLLYYIIGPRYNGEDPNDELVFCALCSVSALRNESYESTKSAIKIILENVKKQLTPEKLKIQLECFDIEYKSDPW